MMTQVVQPNPSLVRVGNVNQCVTEPRDASADVLLGVASGLKIHTEQLAQCDREAKYSREPDSRPD